ncbi:MAG: DUF350 domain-containing protein [Spirochaetales bacterium]|nr:DUF350 domain-containing protein [Spirochaetales bacterium]
MNVKLLFISLFQICAGLILGTTLLYIAFKFMSSWLKKSHKIEQHNTSTGLLIGSVLFSVGYFITSIIEPLITTFRMLMKNYVNIGVVIGIGCLYMLGYFVLAFVFSFLVVVVSFFLFTLFTRDINEIEEIKNNNIGIAIIIAVVIVTMAIIVGNGFTLLTESIIPFPAMPKKIG